MKYTDENAKCIVCAKKGVDLHHWKSRKSGGPDERWNLIELCRRHHTEFHKTGPSVFIWKYPVVRVWLESNGWWQCELTKKWHH